MASSRQDNLMDVDLVIYGCEDLPRMDYVGHADPYVVAHIVSPDGRHSVRYKTAVLYKTASPIWDEEIRLQNVPQGTVCTLQVWDKDQLKADEGVGSCRLVLDADILAAAASYTPPSSSTCGYPLSSYSAPAAAHRTSTPGSVMPAPSSSRTIIVAAAAAVTSRLPGLARSSLQPPAPSSSSSAVASSARGGYTLRLPIQPAPCVQFSAGHLVLTLRCRPASGPPGGPMLHCGPVRYRVSVSTLAGALARHTQDDGWMAFAAYKLALAAVPHFFPRGAEQHWNTQYDNARKIFCNPAMVAAVRAQHAMLYADDRQQRNRGGLPGGGDLLTLLRGGVRARQRRYYTYAITADGALCFSETGAALVSDFMSKHAMHACCAEWVVYAGEFCLVPPGLQHHPGLGPPPLVRSQRMPSGTALQPPTAAPVKPVAVTAVEAEADAAAALTALAGVGGCVARGWRLVADNNSGTYAPSKQLLPALAALLQHNFPGLQVEVVDMAEPRLKEYHARVPSRMSA